MHHLPEAERIFTLHEANSFVPVLHRLISAQMLVKARLEEALAEVHGYGVPLATAFDHCVGESPALWESKEALFQVVQEFEAGWSSVRELGCVVKDPERGYLDFYGHAEDRLVFYCWRFGEEEVAHRHEIGEPCRCRVSMRGLGRHRLLNLAALPALERTVGTGA